MSGVSDPAPLRIVALRAQISELGAVIRQLRKAGIDNAAAELLLSRKRAELECPLRSPSRGTGKARSR